MRNWGLVAGVLLAGAASCSAALAASFDCAKAAAPREKLICQTPDLSKLDDQVAASYAAALGRLSDAGGRLLRDSQRSWLQYAVTVCPLTARAATPATLPPVDCMKTHYRERLDQLALAGQHIGPFVFNRIDLFASLPVCGTNSTIPGFLVDHSAFPQIDNPATEEALAWNKTHQRSIVWPRLNCVFGLSGGISGANTDYTIGYANKNLISVLQTFREHHGGSHGTYKVWSENILLRPGLPRMKDSDVFVREYGWIGKLQALFKQAFLKRYKNDQAVMSTTDFDRFDTVVAYFRRWNFTSDGMAVNFDVNDLVGTCPTCGPRDVEISWADLKPLLRPDSVVP